MSSIRIQKELLLQNEENELEQTSQKRNLCEFIENEFKLTKCVRYQQVELDENERANATDRFQENDCWCGRPLAAHPPEAFTNDASIPRAVKVPSYAYGKMRFVDAKQAAEFEDCVSKYVRLNGSLDDDYLAKVCELLMHPDYWAINPPQLIIEVTGTSKEVIGVNKRLTEKFNQGLVTAAQSSKAWLVTGGCDSGVMQLVGNAVARARLLAIPITCLGIASWGVISNRDQLVNIPLRTDNKPVDYLVSSTGGTPLNYGHDHFLLVDNGVEERYGQQIEFRAALMYYISLRSQIIEERNEMLAKSRSHLQLPILPETESECEPSKPVHVSVISIPRVLLVVGGGPNTLRTVELAVKGTEDHPRAVAPVVALAGFGGAGDLIAHGYYFLQNMKRKIAERIEKEYINEAPPEFYAEIVKDSALPRLLNVTDVVYMEESKLHGYINQLYRCVKNRKLITVVNLSRPREVDLDKAILNAIFKADLFRDESCYRMLELARRWDLINVARAIVKKYHRDIKNLEQTRRDDLVTLSIVCGQNDFFELFTEYKLVYSDKYFSRKRFKELYSKVLSQVDVSEEKVLQPRNSNLLRCIQLFSALIASGSLSSLYKPPTELDVFLLSYCGDVIAELLGCYLSNPFTIRPGSEAAKALLVQGVYVWGYRDLFLLQLILNQDKFAMHSWREGRDHLGTALLASIFLRKLSINARANGLISLVKPYRKHSELWQDRAVEVLTKCHEAKPEYVHNLLTRALPTWQNRTVLEIAFYGKRKRFLGQPACISKTVHIWRGRIASMTSTYLICLAALFPLLVFALKFVVPRPPQQSSDASEDGTGTRIERKSMSSIPLIYGKRNTIARPTIKCRFFGCYKKPDPRRVSFLHALYYLYTSPLIKFVFHTIAMLIFLLTFTSFILDTSLHPEGATKKEMAILIWSVCLIFDAIHETIGLDLQVFLEQNSSDTNAFVSETLHRLLNGCYSNIMFDLFSEILLVTSFVLRHVFSRENFVYPHTLYSVSCLFFWIRSFRVFYLSKSMGILIVTLEKLLSILLQFLLLYIVLLVTFAPPLFALIYPYFLEANAGEDPYFLSLLVDVIYQRWWNLFSVGIGTTRSRIEETCPASYATGGHMHSSLEHMYNSSIPFDISSTNMPCQSTGSILGRNYIAAILFVTYLWLTNIAWMNMLIASLARKVEETRASAIEVWAFNYYIGVRTWYHRCLLPAPLSVIELLVRSITYYAIWLGKEKNSAIRKYSSEAENLRWDELERTAVDKIIEGD